MLSVRLKLLAKYHDDLAGYEKKLYAMIEGLISVKENLTDLTISNDAHMSIQSCIRELGDQCATVSKGRQTILLVHSQYQRSESRICDLEAEGIIRRYHVSWGTNRFERIQNISKDIRIIRG